MVRLAVLAISSVIAVSAVTAHAENPGDVLQGIGRAMKGEPPYPDRDRYWRQHEQERAYWHEQHRLDAEQRELDARRRALHDQRRYEEENGSYGR
jgi:predicted kinase